MENHPESGTGFKILVNYRLILSTDTTWSKQPELTQMIPVGVLYLIFPVEGSSTVAYSKANPVTLLNFETSAWKNDAQFPKN